MLNNVKTNTAFITDNCTTLVNQLDRPIFKKQKASLSTAFMVKSDTLSMFKAKKVLRCLKDIVKKLANQLSYMDYSLNLNTVYKNAS